MRTVRAFGQEPGEAVRYGESVGKSMDLGIQQAVRTACDPFLFSVLFCLWHPLLECRCWIWAWPYVPCASDGGAALLPSAPWPSALCSWLRMRFRPWQTVPLASVLLTSGFRVLERSSTLGRLDIVFHSSRMAPVTSAAFSFSLCVLSVQVYIGAFMGGAFGAGSLSIVSVLAYGAILVIDNSLTPGSLSAFVLYSITGERSKAAPTLSPGPNTLSSLLCPTAVPTPSARCITLRLSQYPQLAAFPHGCPNTRGSLSGMHSPTAFALAR